MSSAGLMNSWINSYSTGGSTPTTPGVPLYFINQQLQIGFPITAGDGKQNFSIPNLNAGFGDVKYGDNDAKAGYICIIGSVRFNNGEGAEGILQIGLSNNLEGGGENVMVSVDLATLQAYSTADIPWIFNSTIPWAKSVADDLIVYVKWTGANGAGRYYLDTITASPINALNISGYIPEPS
jgi:hypothetical protein